MGAARKRGTREQRIAQAIAEGRERRKSALEDAPLMHFDPLPIGGAAALAVLVAAATRRRLR